MVNKTYWLYAQKWYCWKGTSLIAWLDTDCLNDKVYFDWQDNSVVTNTKYVHWTNEQRFPVVIANFYVQPLWSGSHGR